MDNLSTLFHSSLFNRYKGGKGGGGSVKVQEPESTPPPQIQVVAPEVTDRTIRKRKKGYMHTLRPGSRPTYRSVLSVRDEDKLG